MYLLKNSASDGLKPPKTGVSSGREEKLSSVDQLAKDLRLIACFKLIRLAPNMTRQVSPNDLQLATRRMTTQSSRTALRVVSLLRDAPHLAQAGLALAPIEVASAGSVGWYGAFK